MKILWEAVSPTRLCGEYFVITRNNEFLEYHYTYHDDLVTVVVVGPSGKPHTRTCVCSSIHHASKLIKQRIEAGS